MDLNQPISVLQTGAYPVGHVTIDWRVMWVSRPLRLLGRKACIYQHLSLFDWLSQYDSNVHRKASETRVLPLNYKTIVWSARWDSNPQWTVSKTVAYANSATRRYLDDSLGLEPRLASFKAKSPAIRRRVNIWWPT